MVCALVFTTLAEMLLGRTGTTPRTAAPAGPLASPRRHHRMTALAAWALIVATTGVPLLALILVALTRAVGLAPVPANWTLANFAEALSGRLLGSLGRSLLLATAAGLIAVGLGTAAALTHRWRGHRIVGAGVLLSFAVPGSTLAVAVLLAYGRALRDSLTLILIAYVAKLWALGHRSVQGSVRSLAPETTWAARASGASPATTLRSVTLPLLRPALFGAFVLVFLFAFHELTMSSLLYGPGTGTLAVAILNLQQIGDVPVTSALAVLLTVPLLIVTVPLLAVGRLSRRIMGTG
jgi:iron(III) transport system permease protein